MAPRRQPPSAHREDRLHDGLLAFAVVDLPDFDALGPGQRAHMLGQRLKATRPNEVWSYDFVSDQTTEGRRLKFLCVVDEFTRECLALEVRRSFRAKDVLAVLARLIARRGVPAHLRSDNGPEFVAQAVQAWLKAHAVGPLSIAPGSPWENA